MPLSRLIALIINAHPRCFRTDTRQAGRRMSLKERLVDCARFACGMGGQACQPRTRQPILAGRLQTNPFFTMSMSIRPRIERDEFDRARDLLHNLHDARMVEPTGIEPTTSSLQS